MSGVWHRSAVRRKSIFAPATRYVADFVGSANEVGGTVVGWEGGFCRVRTPIGDMVGTAAAAVTDAGQNGRVLFRPEHCRIGSGEARDNRLCARLERSMFLGPHVEHVVSIAQTRAGAA